MSQYEDLRAQFEAHADEKTAEQMAAYMRGLFAFYGLKAGKRKELSQAWIKEARKRKVVDWDLLDKCYADEHRECQYFVVDALKAMQRFLTYEDVPRIWPYIKEKQWWDTIDGLAGVIGHIALKDERMDDLMLEWSVDEDFWVRRVAILHQLKNKDKTNAQLLETILVRNFGSDEFFINKAIGWSLREYSKTNPGWVRDFVETHEAEMAPLSIKEASKYI